MLLLTMRSLGSQSPRLENRKVPQGGTSGAEAYLPKRHKHRDVRSREHLTPPEVDKLRKAAPYRPPWRAQRHDDSPGLPTWLACCCTHAPALRSGRPRSGALARQARQERGPQHAPAHRHSNAHLTKTQTPGRRRSLCVSLRASGAPDGFERAQDDRSGWRAPWAGIPRAPPSAPAWGRL
jgi:hypothetical protein